MPDATRAEMEGFSLGKPALVCRWRLSGARLPMTNRHMRALGARRIHGDEIPVELVAWAKQHVEWTLGVGAADNPDGVLMLIVDDTGQAAMTVGPYQPLRVTSLTALAERAVEAAREARSTGVAPEELWAVRGDTLYWGAVEDAAPSASSTLVRDLLRTLGIPATRYEGLADAVLAGDTAFAEAFLVSDEYGVVPASDRTGRMGDKLAGGYERLLERTARRGM